ncbi:MAG TPA: hypothetical protein VM733_19965, partial [Thermoanaerobaculia bacterium]|nr:hypothetical protein [Thermoanaerobaculia bacterium]
MPTPLDTTVDLQRLRETLEPYAAAPWVDEIRESARRQRETLTSSLVHGFESDMLDWLEATNSVSPSGPCDDHLPVLSAIDQALNLGRLTYPEMHALAANATDASSREAVRGTLARARVLVRSGDFSRRMINEVVPPVDWKRAAPAKPDPIMLIATLQSRFAPILNGAVSLLADAAWSDELVPFIEPLLDSSRALTVYASALLLSEKVAGRLAVDVFAARLRSPVSSGCEYVYKVLGDLHRRSDATLQNEIAAL